MTKATRLVLFAAILAVSAAAVVNAHPHFRKSVVAKLPDLEIKLEYITYPWNPSHLSDVKDGFIFNCGNATVEFSKPVTAGGKEIAAGRYLLRARAKDVDSWTFLLVTPPPDRSTPPDMTKAIDLVTKTLTGRPVNDHLSLDISPGHGETEGKALFVLSWGDRQLEGVLAEFELPKK